MTYDYGPPPPPPEPTSTPTPTPTHPGRRSGLHPVTIGHLVMGMVFLTFVAVWVLVQAGVVDVRDDFRLLLPLPWIVGGGVGLLAAVLRTRRL